MNEDLLVEGFDSRHAVLAASRSPLAATVERSMAGVGPQSGVVLVAVSGGPDSTALLLLVHALCMRRDPSRFERLVVGHVDHGLRPEGEAEAGLVRDIASRLGVDFTMETLAWPEGGSVSSGRAREARWAALRRMARSEGAATILCGHHADDQAETVLLRLARGTGLNGLASIPEVRRLDDDVRVMRPLISARRREILELVELVGIPVVSDPTNERRDTARGVVRHEVLPRLESIHPGAATRIAAVAEEAASIERDPSEVRGLPAPRSIRWDREVFRDNDEPTVARMLRESIRSLPGIEVSVVEGISRGVWTAVARAIRDGEVRPRDFRIPGLGAIRLKVDTIDLQREEGGDR